MSADTQEMRVLISEPSEFRILAQSWVRIETAYGWENVAMPYCCVLVRNERELCHVTTKDLFPRWEEEHPVSSVTLVFENEVNAVFNVLYHRDGFPGTWRFRVPYGQVRVCKESLCAER